MINIEDFKKIEIKIGKVISAERIPEADKLLKLVFDIGTEKRQIMAGIAQFIEDVDSLVGKQMPIITNIEPRKLRGYESQGMLIAISTEKGPVLLHPEKEVVSGSNIN